VRILVKRASIDFLLMLLLIITYPVNYRLLAGMRPVDVVLLVFAVWGMSQRCIRMTGAYFLLLVFAMLMLLSTWFGILFIGIRHPENFIFFYKYAVPFLCIWLVVSASISERQVCRLLQTLLLSLVFMVIYEFCSLAKMVSASPELVAKFRPNFPFTPPFGSEGGYLGDAHLLAAYLSTGLVAVFLSHQLGLLKLRLLFYYPLLLSVAVAMLLTGSRNGIVTSGAVVSLFLLSVLMKGLLSENRPLRVTKRSFRLYALVLLLICGMFFVSAECSQRMGKAERILDRAFSFDFSADASVLGRVRKLASAANLVLNGPILIGIGMQSSPRRFFDGALGALLVSAGLLGVFVYAAIPVLFLAGLRTSAKRNGRNAEYVIAFFVTLNYALANLITEFFLVSRSVIPFCILLGLLTRRIRTSSLPMPTSDSAAPGGWDATFLRRSCLRPQ